MPCDIYASPEHEAFRETVRKFTEEELRPRAREFEAAGRMDKKLFERMGELGMLGLRYEPEYGGAGLDWSFSAVMHEELARADCAGATLAISVHTEMATPSLAQFGSPLLKRNYLAPTAIAGQTVSAIAVTEPEAGSDVAGIKTRAVRDGDDWVIDGSKIYITNAAIADWLCLLAVTDPDAGHGGFSQIIVPTDTPGVRFDLLDKIGHWGSDTGQFFEGVRVPVANTIGEAGRGFQQQMMQFQDERLVGCISGLYSMEHLWEETKRWTEERVIFGKPLSKMQNTQFKMAGLWSKLQAAKELERACVRQILAGEDATTLITAAKLFVVEVSMEVATECMQLFGGYGYMRECPAGRAFVDTRLAAIGGGSSETMLQYLAKQLGF